MYIRSEIHFLYHTKSTYPGDYPVSVYVPILQMIMEMSNISSTHLRQKQVSTVDDIYIYRYIKRRKVKVPLRFQKVSANGNAQFSVYGYVLVLVLVE